MMSGGINTAEELKQLAAGASLTGRIGLLTSAWHLPRRCGWHAARDWIASRCRPTSQAHARTRANFSLGAAAMEAIPTAGSAGRRGPLGKEYLARAIGR